MREVRLPASDRSYISGFVKYVIAIRLAAGIGLALAQPAAASNWIDVGRGQDRTRIYVDTESVRQSGDQTQVWVKMDFRQVPSVPARSSKALHVYDCASARSAVIEYVAYRANGSVLAHGENDLDLRPVVPDSIGDLVMREVCQ